MIKANANSKYHFLRYRHGEFDPSLIEGLILTFDNDNYKAMAYLDLASEALRQGEADQALQLLYKLEKLNINSPDILDIAREMYIRLNILTGDTETLDQLVNSPESNKMTGNTYALARLYLAAYRDNDPAAASMFESTGTRDPFDEEAVLQSAIYFDNTDIDDEKAYNILLSAVNINPYSRRINEAYILQCLEMGLDNYAAEALEKYRQIVPETTYIRFMNTYTSAKEMADNTADSW